MSRIHLAAAFGLLAALPLAAQADAPVTRTVEADYEDVLFDIETAITNAGLVIDSFNHVGDMLERTKADVGGTRTIFTNAKTFNFCSAEVSRAVMEADPLNLQYCPYGIFVMETPEAPGQVIVGHELYPEGVMDQVNALLDGIIDEALSDY